MQQTAVVVLFFCIDGLAFRCNTSAVFLSVFKI
jgi:hypothetical protein